MDKLHNKTILKKILVIGLLLSAIVPYTVADIELILGNQRKNIKDDSSAAPKPKNNNPIVKLIQMAQGKDNTKASLPKPEPLPVPEPVDNVSAPDTSRISLETYKVVNHVWGKYQYKENIKSYVSIFSFRHQDHINAAKARLSDILKSAMPLLTAEKLPREILSLGYVLTGFNHDTSLKDIAMGTWLLSPHYFAKVSDGIAHDDKKSTAIYIGYMQTLMQKYKGDSLMATAGYLCGETYIDYLSIKYNTKSYDHIEKHLSSQCRDNVAKVIASSYILTTE